MAQQIIKQPDGLLAIYDSAENAMILSDATPEMIVEYKVGLKREEITQSVHRVIDALDCGKRPYYQFTMSYDEAIALINGNQDEE